MNKPCLKFVKCCVKMCIESRIQHKRVAEKVWLLAGCLG